MSSRDPHEPPTPPPGSSSTTAGGSRRDGNPRSPGGGPLRWIPLYTRGLIVDQHLRRVTMFYVVIAAMLMFFVGDLFPGEWLDWHRHISRFLVYWLICGWLTVLAALLAIYDLLLLRIQHRLLRRELHKRILEEESEKNHPSDEP